MVFYETVAVTLPAEEDNSPATPPQTHPRTPPRAPEYAPISLNHLIQEGIQLYLAQDRSLAKGHSLAQGHARKPNIQFEVELAPNLCRTIGEPTQLRRLFSLLVNCLADSLQLPTPFIKFVTKNIVVTTKGARQIDLQGLPGPENYVLLRISINGNCLVPSFEPHCALAQTDNINVFAWTQIFEVIQLHRGRILPCSSSDAVTSLAIVLPAMQRWH